MKDGQFLVPLILAFRNVVRTQWTVSRSGHVETTAVEAPRRGLFLVGRVIFNLMLFGAVGTDQ